jgi:hypothetical protein
MQKEIHTGGVKTSSLLIKLAYPKHVLRKKNSWSNVDNALQLFLKELSKKGVDSIQHKISS